MHYNLYLFQQQDLLGVPKLVLLKNGETRWDIKFMMMERMLQIKDAVNAAIMYSNINKCGPSEELNLRDWELMEKVVECLRPFRDASKMLQREDASVSCYIPVVKTVLKLLESSRADLGVMNYKKNLYEAVETKFAGNLMVYSIIHNLRIDLYIIRIYRLRNTEYSN